MYLKTVSIVIFQLLIVFWPMLMTRVAWDTANCDFPPNAIDVKCRSAWFFHILVFLAPVIWLLVVLFLIVYLRIIIFEERRPNQEYLRELLVAYLNQRAQSQNLHQD